MKFGIRRPSLRKRIAARTSPKRFVRHSLGFKAPRGWGWLTNPRRAAYNRVYARTTVGLGKGCAVAVVGWLVLTTLSLLCLRELVLAAHGSTATVSPTPAERPQAQRAPETTEAIHVFVFTAPPDAGLVPFDQKDREDSVHDLRRALGRRLPGWTALVRERSDGEVLVEVMGRERKGDDRTVHLRLNVGDQTLTLDGTNDDRDWSDAAGNAARRIAGWFKTNERQLRSSLRP
ncbi:MAG: hypothetical protein U0132_23795 [Gemmatimonadaceae bacterium]